jgi:hypothetical protein
MSTLVGVLLLVAAVSCGPQGPFQQIGRRDGRRVDAEADPDRRPCAEGARLRRRTAPPITPITPITPFAQDALDALLEPDTIVVHARSPR